MLQVITEPPPQVGCIPVPRLQGRQLVFERGDFQHWKDWEAAGPQIQSLRRVRDMRWHKTPGPDPAPAPPAPPATAGTS